MFKLIFIFLVIFRTQLVFTSVPLVITTWNFESSAAKAWETVYTNKKSAIDAVVEGCSVCERDEYVTSVGYGGSPDENGETTLDAMIMDGATMNIGAIAALRNVKDAIAVARTVLENTKHTMLVGSQATEFAIQMGFKNESLRTDTSQGEWQNWKNNSCQPNFWIKKNYQIDFIPWYTDIISSFEFYIANDIVTRAASGTLIDHVNVQPNSSSSCGPYEPISHNDINNYWNTRDDYLKQKFGSGNHDTIGMIVIDGEKNIVAGTSTNGARNKIPGRVGDAPIPGSGAYADNTVGAATATGDGDVMMRFLPAVLAVEFLRSNMTPHDAGESALRRIVPYYPDFVGAMVVAKVNGDYGAACHGLEDFPYTVHTASTGNVVERVKCFSVN